MEDVNKYCALFSRVDVRLVGGDDEGTVDDADGSHVVRVTWNEGVANEHGDRCKRNKQRNAKTR